MKVPIFGRKRSRIRWMLPLALVALFLFGGTVVFAIHRCGRGGDAARCPGRTRCRQAKGWVATDTYRVMNFAVLAIGLFLVLKKPVSQALGGRIQGIKEQLEELEEKKRRRKPNWLEYDAKMAELDKEAETLLAEYVKQGEDAKARILKEAEALPRS
jgi:F-type H+-transporting ATPase subunit b